MCIFARERQKRESERKRRGGGGKKPKNSTISFWPRASPPLERLGKRQEGVCVFLCYVLLRVNLCVAVT